MWFKRSYSLDAPLFYWSKWDTFRIRDLLNGGCLILGRAGSGKTSSSGRTLLQSIVRNPHSAGLVLAAKPEDAGDIIKIFRKVGRRDLIVFGAKTKCRFNFLNYVAKGDARNVVQCLMMIGETLTQAEGRDDGKNNRFYRALEERILYNVITALQCAGEPVAAEHILEFLMTAPTSPEQALSQSYHCQVMQKAWDKPKKRIKQRDFSLCKRL